MSLIFSGNVMGVVRARYAEAQVVAARLAAAERAGALAVPTIELSDFNNRVAAAGDRVMALPNLSLVPTRDHDVPRTITRRGLLKDVEMKRQYIVSVLYRQSEDHEDRINLSIRIDSPDFGTSMLASHTASSGDFNGYSQEEAMRLQQFEEVLTFLETTADLSPLGGTSA